MVSPARVWYNKCVAAPSFKHGLRLAQKGGVGMFFEALFSLVLALIPQVLANLISHSLIKWIDNDK